MVIRYYSEEASLNKDHERQPDDVLLTSKPHGNETNHKYSSQVLMSVLFTMLPNKPSKGQTSITNDIRNYTVIGAFRFCMVAHCHSQWLDITCGDT